MTEKQLTRRPDEEPDSWSIWYDDVCVGGIAKQPWNAQHGIRWLWTCGFCPGGSPKDYSSGLTDTFEAARDQWQAAWEIYLPKRTEIDFEEWRHNHRFMADKAADTLPPIAPANVMTCACGATFDSHKPADVQEHAEHVYLTQRARLGGW